MAITDAELNQNIKLTPYDKLLQKTLLWMFPIKFVRPNHITVARFALSPLVFWLFWQQQYKAGLIVFLAVALTDAIDGSMARTRRQITVWGTIYDGVADKILITGAVLILVIQHLSVVLAAVIIGIEVITAAVALYLKSRGVIRPANLWGKIKMNLQVAAVALLLIYMIWNIPELTRVSYDMFVASIILAVVSISAHARSISYS